MPAGSCVTTGGADVSGAPVRWLPRIIGAELTLDSPVGGVTGLAIGAGGSMAVATTGTGAATGGSTAVPATGADTGTGCGEVPGRRVLAGSALLATFDAPAPLSGYRYQPAVASAATPIAADPQSHGLRPDAGLVVPEPRSGCA